MSRDFYFFVMYTSFWLTLYNTRYLVHPLQIQRPSGIGTLVEYSRRMGDTQGTRRAEELGRCSERGGLIWKKYVPGTCTLLTCHA